MSLVHEFKKLVHDCLQEFPMSFEKSRILPHDVHDVGGNDSFVVLPALHFAQTKQIFDYCDKKSFLRLLICEIVNI